MTNSSQPGSAPQLSEAHLAHYVDMWKKAVDVQQHFNDIEFRIRGLALSAATLALGAAGVAAKDGTHFGWVSLAAVILGAGLILWYAFYFVDRVWYHPLLKAAVNAGTEMEKEIQKVLPKAGMTAGITAGSPYRPSWIIRRLGNTDPAGQMHSDDKLEVFYRLGAIPLAVAAVILEVSIFWTPNGPHADKQPVTVNVTVPATPRASPGVPSVMPSASTPTPRLNPSETATVSTSP